ncbi:MAG: SDR family NAD(P)-dependent oxidoreductase [Mycobacterium sp.]
MTDAEAAAAAVDFAVAELGRIDVVVNNAGYANSAPIEEVDPADFRAQIEANLFGEKVIIEPGAFRTDWMGSSMTMQDPVPTTATHRISCMKCDGVPTELSRVIPPARRASSSMSSNHPTHRGGCC